jgi:hypothetical protein
MDNCQMCHKFHNDNDKCGGACEIGIKTLPCNPTDRKQWFKHKLPEGLDPVLSNIYNGCWICNINPQQEDNQKLCRRNFFDGPNIPPYKSHIDVENKLRYSGLSNNKYRHYKK